MDLSLMLIALRSRTLPHTIESACDKRRTKFRPGLFGNFYISTLRHRKAATRAPGEPIQIKAGSGIPRRQVMKEQVNTQERSLY